MVACGLSAVGCRTDRQTGQLDNWQLVKCSTICWVDRQCGTATLTTTSCFSADSERPHCCYHLTNKAENNDCTLDIPYTIQCTERCPENCLILKGSALPHNTWILGHTWVCTALKWHFDRFRCFCSRVEFLQAGTCFCQTRGLHRFKPD